MFGKSQKNLARERERVSGLVGVVGVVGVGVGVGVVVLNKSRGGCWMFRKRQKNARGRESMD